MNFRTVIEVLRRTCEVFKLESEAGSDGRIEGRLGGVLLLYPAWGVSLECGGNSNVEWAETVEIRSSLITVNQTFGYQRLPCGIDAVRNHQTLPHRTSTSVAPPLHHRYA